MAKNNSSQSSIQTLVTEFTNQLQLVIRRTAREGVLAALADGGSTSARRGPGRPRGSKNVVNRGPGRPGVRGKRTSEAVAQMGARLHAYVKSKPGLRADHIAKAFRTDVKTIRLPMQRLIAEKKLTTRGQRRGTTYFAAGAAASKAKRAKRKKKRGRRK